MQYKGPSKRSAVLTDLSIWPNKHMRVMSKGTRTYTQINVSHVHTQSRDRLARQELQRALCWPIAGEYKIRLEATSRKSSWYFMSMPEGKKQLPLATQDKTYIFRASLVAQWLRVCLPMQATQVRALVWEDPTCRGATGPVSHNYWACASGACALQQERPRQWEARTPRWRVAPARRNWRKPLHRNEDPTQPKIK